MLLFLFGLVVCFELSTAAPAAGSCMCLSTSGVHYRSAAGTHSHVYGSLNSGECYKFNGGVLTKDGYTWYELQDVHGHHRVWVASNYLKTSTSSHCSGSGSGSSSGSHSFATGPVSQQCLECICKQESGCKPIGCHWDVNSDSCGYFQIKEGYWNDCGSPGTSWKSCANDLHCSSLCVQNYMRRYAAHYKCSLNCQGYAREHNGGPNGCHHSSTLGYWAGVKSHSGCGNLH
ncbi:hypothetical protein FSP39_020417 [Pinctada imbricata]|uniref:lysozyme n=1 Tax=Pinctada imbricata TaxID=66713 RepID=A0AA88YGV4_PINIB|nr:hypothetical protein FSP39_020417 [Pinctada imbricata]